MPKDLNEQAVGELVTDIIHVSPLQSYFADVYVAWELILAMVGVTFVVSILYSVLIRYCAGCMVWVMIFTLMILLLGIGAITALLPSTQFLKDIFQYDDLPETLKDRGFQIAVSVITLTLFSLGIIIICCMKRQIAICNPFNIQRLESLRQLQILSEIAAGPSLFPSISPSFNCFSLPFGSQ